MDKVHTHYTNKYVFFFRKESPFSQFYPCSFCIFHSSGGPSIRFTSAEQYMMYRKAVLFKDEESASKILKEQDPNECKKLGRKVNGFIKEIWDKEGLRIVREGNVLKFYQNPDLFSHLLLAGNRKFVEASPYDRIWGIGIGIDDSRLKDETIWGQNLLGEILTSVKDFAINNTKEAIQY